MSKSAVHFICGDDEFIVGSKGQSQFDELTKNLSDPLNAEVVEGMVNNQEELQSKIGQFIASAQTLSMFGDKKVIWFKSINFLGDNRTASSEGAKQHIERLQDNLSKMKSPESVELILTASPIDRRKTFYKWAKSNLSFEDIVADKKGTATVEKFIREAAQKSRVVLAEDAIQLLIARVNGDARMAVNEVEKLALYLGEENAQITYELINEMVPSFGDGDQFEAVEEFYSLNLKRALVGLRRHFFFNRDGRMLINGLINRTRLLIQLRTILDSGILKAGQYGINQNDLNIVSERFAPLYDGVKGKSNFNIFSQHPYFLSRLLRVASRRECKLATLMRFNQVLVDAFEQTIARPNNVESVIRDAFVRCLHRGD